MASDTPDVYLRFDGLWGDEPLQGECMDEKHPGTDGWIQIHSFSFGFGADEATESSEARTREPATPNRTQGNQAAAPRTRAPRATAATRSGLETWGKSGPLNFDKFSFTKSTDRLSAALVAICHDGNYKIPSVEVEAVRYGAASADFKIPFLRLVFQQVRIKSCKLSLTNDDLPSEDVEFEYDIVNLSCLWTDNATGDRRPERPIRAGWNLPDQKQSVESGT